MKTEEQSKEEEQDEPVAEVVEGDDFSKQVIGIGNWRKLSNGTKLYTKPQQRKTLTEKQIDEIYYKSDLNIDDQYNQMYAFVKAIENKLKELNK